MPITIGERLGFHEITALVGKGGMGEVYRARDTKLKRDVAILGNSRRQHYRHAALLVASCGAFAPKSRAAELLRWATDLRQQCWRRHAFREELARECESLGVLVPS
jgi:hypothetical protein